LLTAIQMRAFRWTQNETAQEVDPQRLVT
jgi:hypothetical protein